MPVSRHPAVIIVSGIPGAGKTTVSRILARRFERGVHIESDQLQLMIARGGLWPDGEPRDEATRQLRLRGRNCCLLADSFFAAGFTVVIDDVVIGSRLDEFLSDLRSVPVFFVLLTPSPAVVSRRDAGRDQKHVFHKWGHLDQVMRDETRRVGLWLDTSGLDADGVVDTILESVWNEGQVK